MAGKIKFIVNKGNFSDLIDKLSDLTKIDDTIKLKIDADNLLIYSIMSSGQTMLAFKNYLLNTSEYFDINTNLQSTYDIVIINAKKFVKNLSFINNSDKITLEISYKESADDDSVMTARSIQLVGGKFKVNWLAGEHYEVRDINKNALKQSLDLNNKKWSFAITRQEFFDVKQLSNINSDKIISISVQDGRVILSEKAAWEFELESIETRNASLILNKKFLSCINDNVEKVDFNIFDNFMLVKDVNSNLMLSFEQDFSDE